MWAGRPAGRADVADGLTLRHIVAHGDDVVRHVAVQARVAVGMVDRDHVAVGFIVAGGGHGAGLRGINRRTGACREVHAVVPLIRAAQRVDAVAIRVGDRNRIGKRIQEASCRRCCGAGASAVRRDLIVVLPVQLCLPRRLFLRERVKVVRLGLLDLRGHLVLEFFVVLILFRHGVVFCGHLQNQLVRLGSLLLHLCLLLSKIVLCLLEIIHLGLELCALSRDLRGNVCHLFEHQLVGLGDLVDHIDLVEKIGEAAGAKQDRPVGNFARLLHRAQAGLVLLVEPRLLGLGLLELVLPLSKSVFAFLKSHPSPSILICMSRIKAVHDFMRL